MAKGVYCNCGHRLADHDTAICTCICSDYTPRVYEMDDTEHDEANEHTIRRIRRATSAKYYAEQPRTEQAGGNECNVASHATLVAELAALRAALAEIHQYRDTCTICMDSDDDTELDTEYRKGARAVLDNVAKLAAKHDTGTSSATRVRMGGKIGPRK